MALAQGVYEVPWHVILDSAARALTAWDLITSMIKAWVFGTIIAVVRSSLSENGVLLSRSDGGKAGCYVSDASSRLGF